GAAARARPGRAHAERPRPPPRPHRPRMRDATGRVQAVLVLGGGSDIARATLCDLLRDGPLTAVLAARDPDGLDAAELEAGGARVERVRFDARDTASHAAVLDGVFERHGDVDVVLVAFGVLGDQEQSERDAAAAVALAEVNFVGAVSAVVESVAR